MVIIIMNRCVLGKVSCCCHGTVVVVENRVSSEKLTCVTFLLFD